MKTVLFGINLEAIRWTGLTQLGVSGDGRDAGRNTNLWIAGHGLLIKDILGIGNPNCDLVKMCSRVSMQSYRYSRGDDWGRLDWMAVQTKASIQSGQEVGFPSCPVSSYIVHSSTPSMRRSGSRRDTQPRPV
jgi:hypothetical protein